MEAQAAKMQIKKIQKSQVTLAPCLIKKKHTHT